MFNPFNLTLLNGPPTSDHVKQQAGSPSSPPPLPVRDSSRSPRGSDASNAGDAGVDAAGADVGDKESEPRGAVIDVDADPLSAPNSTTVNTSDNEDAGSDSDTQGKEEGQETLAVGEV